MKKQRTSVFATAGWILLGLGGCAVGPHYAPPVVDLARFHSVDAVGSRPVAEQAPQLDAWWDGFNDPELTRTVERALDQNLDLAAAMARVEQGRAAARGAGARLLPSFDASAQTSWRRQSLESPLGAIGGNLSGFDRNQHLYDVGAAASWEIDLFGGLRRMADAAIAETQVAEADRIGTRILVAADVADAYLRIRGDQARLAIVADQVATNSRILDLFQRRFEQGLATAREVAQAEALLAGSRAALQPLRIDLEAQLNRLDVLVGVQPGTYAVTLSAAASIPSAPPIEGAAPIDVLRRRPDIISAERRVAAANARIGAAIAEYYPKFSIAGLLGFESSTLGSQFRASTFQPQGLLGIRWRLFDFGKIDAQIAAAKGAEAEALAQYRQSVLRAAEDVENAFTALVQLEIHVAELGRAAAALQRARDLARVAYEGGVIPLTDVLDTNRQKLATDDALAQARVDTAVATVAVFRALGGGWSSDSATLMGSADVSTQ